MDFIDLKKKYKNLTTGTKIIIEYLKTVEIDTEFQNEDFKRILSLHDNPNKNTDIEYFMVKLNIYNKRGLYIKVKNILIDSVSYVLCLRNLYDKPKITPEISHRKDTLMALRNAINGGKRAEFKEENKNGYCCICESEENMEVDHYGVSFQEIVDDFFIVNSFKYEDIRVYSNKKINNWYMELEDPLISDKWVKYHDDIAEYRLLCKSCNCSIGSSGYKSKVFV